MKIVILLVLVPLVKCFKCPDVKGVDNFDENKILGDWYVVRYTPNRIDKGFKCGVNSVLSYVNCNIHGTYRRLHESMNNTNYFNYTMTRVDGRKPNLSVIIETDKEAKPINIKYVYIVDTNYDDYLMYFMCIDDGENSEKAGWLQAKNKRSLSKEAIGNAMKKFQQYDLEPEDFLTNDETTCKE